MGDEAKESFVRWQTITREYFSSVSNLAIGLASGLLAFLSSGFVSSQPSDKCLLVVGSVSLSLLATSVGLGVWCSINRLRDFRATAQIARSRYKDEHVPPETRQENKVLGQFSWRLFWWQLVLFGLGAGGVAIVIIAKLWA